MKKLVNITFSLLLSLVFIPSTYGEVPAGYYYQAQGKTKSALKTALAQIAAPTKVLSYGSGYGATWEGFYNTDRNFTNNSVIDMYSPIVRMFSLFNAVDGMHIEHSLPKSWWGSHENYAYKDLFHLYPADGITNSTKNNLPLGEVFGTPNFDNGVSKIGKNGFGNFYDGASFEPADEYKGDFARSYLYITTIYEDLDHLWNSPMMNNNTYPVWKPWARELLLKWHREDPVSDKEKARIEAVYAIQGNRNPFIDYPDLVEYIWGADTLKTYPFPVETNPFLILPKQNTIIDFGVILQNSTKSFQLPIHGVNLTSDLSLSIKNNSPAFRLVANTVSKNAALNGTQVELQFSPTNAGAYQDTLIISSGGLFTPISIPISAHATSKFAVLEPLNVTSSSGQLEWIAMPNANGYVLNVFKGDKVAGDLIISGYVEGSSWNKAIEIYNGTGKDIDLSQYSLQKQSNGIGAFGSTLNLSGILPHKSSYLIVHKNATLSGLTSKASHITESVLEVNGNDAIELLRDGVSIDRVGFADAGADVIWGLDLSLQRKSNITHPQLNFNLSEWNVLPIDAVDFLKNHTMDLLIGEPISILNKQVGSIANYTIEGLKPSSIYTYTVEAILSDKNVKAVNSAQIKTLAPEIPVIMEPYDITSNSFVASWEKSPFADYYLLDVFKYVGAGKIVINEEFNNIGTNGRPLPEGWTGTASGNYTTAASSGNAIPSISLKSNGEWLQTPVVPANISYLKFMYRFPSAATGSSFVVEGFNGTSWQLINKFDYSGTTAKSYPEFNFSSEQNIRSIRFTYNKSVGNLALDDIQIHYGQEDLEFIHQNKTVNSEIFEVGNLQPATSYNYRVRSVQQSILSDYSEIKNVVTLEISNEPLNFFGHINFYLNNGKIIFYDLEAVNAIQLYSLTGVCISTTAVHSNRVELELPQKGIYIISLLQKENKKTIKIIY